MKKLFVSFVGVYLSAAIGLSLFFNAAIEMANAQSQAQEAAIPLEGLDPVLLIQGKEILGKPNIHVVRGKYKYLFSSEENKAAFEKDPARYEIQLGSSCARMGPQVRGKADIYTVYEGRIYIFGSRNCLQLFEAAPKNYIETATPTQIDATPEAIERGRMLIEKAVSAMGGAARVDSIKSYQETGKSITISQQGEVEFSNVVTKLFPDRIHWKQVRQFGTVVDVLSSGDSFVYFYNDSQKDTREMREAERADLEKQFKRNSLETLRARKRPDFKVAATGADKVGETAVEQVEIALDGIYLRLGIDAETGRILSLTYTGRQAGSGEVGEIVQTFSDFRTVDGLTLPFKTSGTFNGSADPRQSYTVESITINGKVDPAIFERPRN